MTAETAASTPAEQPPLYSTRTLYFGPLLEHLNLSLLITTGRARKLVVLRADGRGVSTHLRYFPRPTGLACDGERLAVGTAVAVCELRDVPAVARQLEPRGKYDACFLPRATHVTGDVQVREMAWVGDDLVFVSARFSCLARRAVGHSFAACWKPRFISALAPEDRCHLNGLGLRDGRVRYVTALGATDTPEGWRADRRGGGILIDVPSGEIIAGGLALPHSPRWHRGRLWLLESGTGRVGCVDEATGRFEAIAELPGFPRGLSFHGRLAFVGLSQVRKGADFSSVAITERPGPSCGVWVLDVITGQTVAYLKFEEDVQEIFAVEVLPGRSFPDVLNDDVARIAESFVLLDEALANVATPLCESADAGRACVAAAP
jgi:uncharacterized protein (TIGR03032 family)